MRDIIEQLNKLSSGSCDTVQLQWEFSALDRKSANFLCKGLGQDSKYFRLSSLHMVYYIFFLLSFLLAFNNFINVKPVPSLWTIGTGHGQDLAPQFDMLSLAFTPS